MAVLIDSTPLLLPLFLLPLFQHLPFTLRSRSYDERLLYPLSFDVVKGSIEGEQAAFLALLHSRRPSSHRNTYYVDPPPQVRYNHDKQYWKYYVEDIDNDRIYEAIGRTCSVAVFEAFASQAIIPHSLASGIASSKDYTKSLQFVNHVTKNKTLGESIFLLELLNRLVEDGNINLLDALISPFIKSKLRRHDPQFPFLLDVKFNKCTATFDPRWALIGAAENLSVEGFLKSLAFFEEQGIQFDYSSDFSSLFFEMQSIEVLQALEKRVMDPAKLNAMFDKAEIYDSQNPVVPHNNKHLEFHIYLARRFANKMKGVRFNAVFARMFLEDQRLIKFFGESAVPMVEFLSVFVNELGCMIPSSLFEDIIHGQGASKFCLTPLLRFFVENDKAKVSLPPTEFTTALFRNPSSFEEATAVLLLYLKRLPQVDLASVIIAILGLPLEIILLLMGPLDVFIAVANCSMSKKCYSSFLDNHRNLGDVEQFKRVILWLIERTQSLDEIPLDLLLNVVADPSLLDWILSRRDLFRFGESNYDTLITEGLIGIRLEEPTNTYLRAIPVNEIISKMDLLRNANVPYSESLISEILDVIDVTGAVSDHFEDDLLVVIEYARKELKCAWDEKVGRAAIPYRKFPKIFAYFLWEKCPIDSSSVYTEDHL